MTHSEVQNKISGVHSLRGLASLAVCWFHFTNGNPHYLEAGVLKASGSYGWVGVEAFFVISGFIIPYSLFRSSYNIRHFPQFVVKRILRLDPPYLTSILFIVILSYLSTLSPLYSGEKFAINWLQLLCHLGYLNAFLNMGWLNPVFWSLAIEFQYYLLIGLIFPLIMSRTRSLRVMTLAALACIALCIRQETLICHYLFLFLIGILFLQYYVKIIGLSEALLTSIPVALGCSLTLGKTVTITAVVSICMIMAPSLQSKVLLFLGDISYSLYLIHVPFGGRLINLGQRFAHGSLARIVVLVLALGLSVLIAYVFFRYVERPWQRLSSSIRYGDQARRCKDSSDDLRQMLRLCTPWVIRPKRADYL